MCKLFDEWTNEHQLESMAYMNMSRMSKFKYIGSLKFHANETISADTENTTYIESPIQKMITGGNKVRRTQIFQNIM